MNAPQPADPRDYYVQRRASAWDVLAPTLWLVTAWTVMVAMLWIVGYLGPDVPSAAWEKDIKVLDAAGTDFSVRRAYLAFSGVTLAITFLLALTSAFWCWNAGRDKNALYRDTVFKSVAVVFIVSVGLALPTVYGPFAPFTSVVGQALLLRVATALKAPLADAIPMLMFWLSCIVPSILLMGATYLLQPMTSECSEESALRDQLRILGDRLRELDQMLYIGALALMFGTLQLSSGLSVSLNNMPKAADIKLKADMCKALTPTPVAGTQTTPVPGAAPAVADQAGSAPVKKEGEPLTFDGRCKELQTEFLRLDAADSLRQLVKGVTLCFGLSFSALLAAVYVPSFFVLRNMVEPRAERLKKFVKEEKPEKPEASVADPISKLGAVIATLGPLFAGLLANILAGG